MVFGFPHAIMVFGFPHALVDSNGLALIAGAPADWATLGPVLPANPALSWEYWNGQSWWALEGGNLWTVPPISSLTAASPSRYRRTSTRRRSAAARTTGSGRGSWRRLWAGAGDRHDDTARHGRRDGRPADGQTIDRDLSAIRAPYLTVLDIGYCAQTLVLPEVVLTEDSLGVTDQTSANPAGLPIEVFVPVAELMNPAPVPDPPPTPPRRHARNPVRQRRHHRNRRHVMLPAPMTAAKAPCIAPEDIKAAATPGAAAAGAVRVLLIGFDAPPPATRWRSTPMPDRECRRRRLSAEILRGGRFEEIAILDDASHGLSEPGRITLSMAAAPELGALFGVSAHWLRLRPRSADTSWSPRLRGLFLNAASALSVETRNIESLGTSSGVPNQRFRLTGAPTAASSLVLRVREAVAEEIAAGLDIVTDIAGMLGQWVRWTEVDDLAGCAPDERVYAPDADAGTIDFGDGIEGAIPPWAPNCSRPPIST